MKHYARTRPSPTTTSAASAATVAAALAVAALVLLGGGCGSSTDPGDGDVTFAFAPVEPDVALQLGQSVQLSATADPGDGGTATWVRGDLQVAEGPSYLYEASRAGTDTMRVSITAQGKSAEYFWAITVAADPDLSPLPVGYLSVAAGEMPVEMVVTWTPVTALHYPIAEYAVAISYDGLITADNWDAATVLALVPDDGRASSYQQVFDRYDGLLPDEQVWVAVRVRDDHGQWSPVSTNKLHTITAEWWIEGTVTSDSLRTALSGVIVRSLAPVRNDNTDGSGYFRLGPYRSIDSVQVRTVAADRYDYVTPYLHYPGDAQYDLVLVGRYGVDAGCAPGMDFLDYLRWVLNKELDPVTPTLPRRLWKPEQYPLSYFAADTTTARGVPLDDLSRQAFELWNTIMGETYFTPAASREEADVVIFYQQPSGAYGRTRLLDPAGIAYSAGLVIPRRIAVDVVPDLPLQTVDQFTVFFEEVVLHELGHVLGFLDHSPCQDAYEHLMRDAGAAGSLARENPIHIDEQRVVRCVRYLPQGIDMTGFQGD